MSSQPRLILALLGTLLAAPAAHAGTKTADPSTYTSVLPTLKPGDTLQLAAGTYTSGLNVTSLNGTAAAWITITGPASGAPAVFEGRSCCNTVELKSSSYVAVKNLTLDGKNLDGVFAVSAKDNLSNLVHHIAIEGTTIINHGASQQTVGISTKTPTWGWIIRRNKIVGAGTGLYLGNSSGDAPFIGGLIENNLVIDPVGYCLQVKWQKPRPSVAGMPTTPQTTIIRHNVLIKNDAPSPDGDRPNLLVGGFPESGPGADDRYEIYGNLFFHNPREVLLQASGRVSIHDNLFVDCAKAAVLLQNHDLPLKQAHVYNNTIHDAATGVSLGSAAPQGSALVGNLIFSPKPISGSFADSRGNLSDGVASAASYLTAPGKTLGQLDLYPLPGKCTGSALDLSLFKADTDHALDFNGSSKGSFSHRGAYAGSGKNPGWKLAAEVKGTLAPPTADAGPGGDASAAGDRGATRSDLGSAGDARLAREGGGDGVASAAGEGGCGCTTLAAPGLGPGALVLLLGLVARRRGVRERGGSRRRPPSAGRPGCCSGC
jgi:uncharacterized protein (TIGR03382 family)